MTTRIKASGLERAEENVQAFLAWMSEKSAGDFLEMVSRGCLSRKEICRELGFCRSVLSQNPRIKALLAGLEARLRKEGVLPPQSPDPSCLPLRAKRQRMPSLEEENNKLLAENTSLKAENFELRRRLRRFQALDEILQDTGRLPR